MKVAAIQMVSATTLDVNLASAYSLLKEAALLGADVELAGVVAGAHCVGGVVEKRMDQGFRLLTVASDIASMRQGMAAELASARASSPTPRSRLQFEE